MYQAVHLNIEYESNKIFKYSNIKPYWEDRIMNGGDVYTREDREERERELNLHCP